MIPRIEFAIALLFLLGCSERKPSCINPDLILETSSEKVFIADSTQSKIFSIRDKGIDTFKGGQYFFYANGCLQSYKFFQTSQAYTYNEEYSNNGSLIRIEGSPLVERKIHQLNKDSLIIDLLFFELNKTYSNIKVRTSKGNSENRIELKDDELYSNMKRAAFGLNVSNVKEIQVYITGSWRDKSSKKENSISDTISLFKDSNSDIQIRKLK
jgi:hypothetical protein